jgi:hypothetical protein
LGIIAKYGHISPVFAAAGLLSLLFRLNGGAHSLALTFLRRIPWYQGKIQGILASLAQKSGNRLSNLHIFLGKAFSSAQIEQGIIRDVSGNLIR